MNSRIYHCSLSHSRLSPRKHSFTYPVYFLALDLAELDEIQRCTKLFGYNRPRPISLWDGDYLEASGGTIRQKLMALLLSCGHNEELSSIALLTVPRCMGYAFNPVNFYYCYGLDGTLCFVIVEINNTYDEKHVYILSEEKKQAPGSLPGVMRYIEKKDFFVSPFNDLRGHYEFVCSPLGDELDIRINLMRNEQLLLCSRIHGRAQPLSGTSLLRTLIRYPGTAALALPRITWQALRLRFEKGLRPLLKPNPQSAMTIRRRPKSPHQLDR